MKIKLPEFDEMLELASEISNLSRKASLLDVKIRSMENSVFDTASSDITFFKDGKERSTSFIENAWKHSGISGEIIPFRNELADVEASLINAKLRFDVYKLMFDIYRTESANERTTSIL